MPQTTEPGMAPMFESYTTETRHGMVFESDDDNIGMVLLLQSITVDRQAWPCEFVLINLSSMDAHID